MSDDFLSLPERFQVETETWRKMLDALSRNIRVAIPCIVQSFNAQAQTIVARPALTEKISIDSDLTDVALPLLYDVPISLPRAGGYTLTLPIQKGDECLVIFADMCIDSWWQSGCPEVNGKYQPQNQIYKRRHDLSDGFAIIGPWSQPRVIDNYSTDSAQLRNDAGTSYVEIAGNDIVNIVADTINIQPRTRLSIETPLMNWQVDEITSSGHTGTLMTSMDLEAEAVTINNNGNPVTINNREFMPHEHHTGDTTTGGVV